MAPRKPKLSNTNPPCTEEGCELYGQQHPRCKRHVTVKKWPDGTITHRRPENYTQGMRYEIVGVQPCGNGAVTGQQICRMHGGNEDARARGRHKAAVQAAQADAAAILAHEGIEGVVDPLAELAQLASEARAFKIALARRVNALTDIRYEGENAEQLRAEVSLYERAMDRTAKFLETLVRLDFDKRRVKLEEDQAGQVVQVVQHVLRRLLDGMVQRGLNDALREAWPGLVEEIVPQEFRKLEIKPTALTVVEDDDDDEH